MLHLLIGLAGALVAGFLVVSSIGRLAGFSDVQRAVRGADLSWLIMCAVGQVVVFVGYAGSLRRSFEFEDGVFISTAASLRLVLASFAATQLFAFAGIGGLAIVYLALRRLGVTRDDAAVRLIALNTSVYFVFGVIGWFAALWTLGVGTAPAGMTLPWIVGMPVIVLAARWFTAQHREARWTAPSDRLMRRALGTGVSAAGHVRRSLTTMEGRPVFRWALLYWAGDIASLWAALQAFGTRPNLATLTLAYATGYLVQSLPIPLIATGAVDAATTFLLHVVGVPLDVALVAVIAHRVFAFWLPVVPGALFAMLQPLATRSATDSLGHEDVESGAR
jgi:putative heme transporter